MCKSENIFGLITYSEHNVDYNYYSHDTVIEFSLVKTNQ